MKSAKVVGIFLILLFILFLAASGGAYYVYQLQVKEIASLKTQLKDLGSNYSYLTKEIKNSEETVSGLDKKLSSLSGDLENNLAKLSEGLNKRKEEVLAVSSKVDSLFSGFEKDISGKVNSLERSYRFLNRELSSVKSKVKNWSKVGLGSIAVEKTSQPLESGE